MEQIKTRFIIAVTNKLSAAEETTAKVDLIEELSDNLYNRYADMVGSGMDSGEAYKKALDELGDTDELLAYLASLGPDGELPRQESRSGKEIADDIRHGLEQVFRETVSQAKDAADQAASMARNLSNKIREKYPNGFKGKISVSFNGDDVKVCDAGPEESEGAAQKQDKGWSFTAGYDKERGGFFCDNGQYTKVDGTIIPSQGLTALEVHVNGDVTVELDANPDADVRIGGDVEMLETRLSSDGTLYVRQGNTASSSFFFHRGLSSADVELTIPRRIWDKIQITTVNGDVSFDGAPEVNKLVIKPTNGDVALESAKCGMLVFKSASGSLELSGFRGCVQAESASGDLSIDGEMDTVAASSASGDVEVTGTVREARCSSASGDITVNLERMPEHLDMDTKSGDCELTMPEEGGFCLQYGTVSGDLESDFALVGKINSKSGEAIYLDGGGRTFRITSVSGDILLHRP